MHAVATCACANVLSEQKSAMASVTLNRTIEQAMRVENEACASRLCSADMQEALAAFFEKRRPAGLQSMCSSAMRGLWVHARSSTVGVSSATDGPWAFLDRADDHEGVRWGVDSTRLS